MKLLSVVDIFPMQLVMITIEYLYVVLTCSSVNVTLYEELVVPKVLVLTTMAVCLSSVSLSTPLYLMM